MVGEQTGIPAGDLILPAASGRKRYRLRPGFGLPRRWYPHKWARARSYPLRIGREWGHADSRSVAAIWITAIWIEGSPERTSGSDAIGIDTMAKVSPFKFLQEVRQEVAKVTWPSRRETTITTVLVFVFATFAGLFFLMADQVIRMTVTLVLGIGN